MNDIDWAWLLFSFEGRINRGEVLARDRHPVGGRLGPGVDRRRSEFGCSCGGSLAFSAS